MGSRGYVLSHQTLNDTAIQGPSSSGFIRYWKDPRARLLGAGCSSTQVTRKSYIGRTGDEIMFIRGYQGEGGPVGISLVSSYFYVGGPYSSVGSDRIISSTRWLVPQLFTVEVNRTVS
jgi:hypothetical protein